MKKLLYLFTIIFALPLSSNASHILGGDLTWTCLANGNYIFHMTTYRDCSGIQWNYQNEMINIFGSPLPSNGVSSITLKPDSNRWMNSRNGDTSPDCTSNYGFSYSCSNSDPGTIQAFYYISDPITLTGVPPSNGWVFNWESPCCRPSTMTNVNQSGTGILLRAVMFPTNTNDSVNFCFDSSPSFSDLPQTLLCRSSIQNYNHVLNDKERDSLSYAWSQPYNPLASNPQPLTYKPGFSPSSPTPGTSTNSSNIPSTLNPETGNIEFAVFSGSATEDFTKVLEVSNWRNGKIISKVYREVPFTITDCPPLPSGNTNQLPALSISAPLDASGTYRDTVVAGTLVDHLITVSDFDSVSMAGNTIQDIFLIPFGDSFTADYSMNGPCTTSGQSSCAYLSPAPTLNVSRTPPRYEFTGLGVIGTRFKWQTDCSDLGDSLSPRTHYFTFKYFDDHCPVPQIGYRTMAITVLPSSQPCSLLTSVRNVNTFQNQVSLFPNPTTGEVQLDLKNKFDRIEVQIRNIQGQLVSTTTFTQQNRLKLEIDGESGIYFIQLSNEKGERANLKVVKQ